MSSRHTHGGIRRALGFVRGHERPIALLLLLTLLVGGLGAVQPLLLKGIFDAVGDGHTQDVLLLIGLLFLLGAMREVFGGVSNWLGWRTRLRVHQSVLEETVERLHALPIAYHQGQGVGRLMTKLERGIQGFVNAITELSFNVLPSLVYLVVSIVVMVRLDLRLAAVVLLFIPLPAIISAFAAPEQTARERDLLGRWSSIYSRFNEVLHGIATVKSFAMEEEEKRRFIHHVADANQVVERGVVRDTLTGGLRNLVTVAASAAAIGAGTWLVLEGHATLGTVVAFLGYLQGLFGPVQGLASTYQTMRKASVSLETVFEILDHEDKLADAPDAEPLLEVRGDVTLERVRFGYDEGAPVLVDIDLHVPSGQVVALVGPSGGGKSTMMALIQRLYDPISGIVRIDGRDIRKVEQRSLRRQIGVVSQEPLLFDDSVEANIAYGCPDARHEDIIAAAVAANAHDFIARLENGYCSKVGERGCLLSVGQRQRLAIARALLRDPSVLILDEATSALDAESEALVQQALQRLIRGRTTFVIAHRLATVCSADRILVLDRGRIIEEGTHQGLMAKGGTYRALVERQSRGLSIAA